MFRTQPRATIGARRKGFTLIELLEQPEADRNWPEAVLAGIR